jgi:hypothetical protein
MTTLISLRQWFAAEAWRFCKFLGRIVIILLEVLALLSGVIVAVDHNMVLGILILVLWFYWMERIGDTF